MFLDPQTLIILMLVVFIVGLVIGVYVSRPSRY